MLSDVDFANRAKKRIRNCVREHVCI
jgi:hypothetical protein